MLLALLIWAVAVQQGLTAPGFSYDEPPHTYDGGGNPAAPNDNGVRDRADVAATTPIAGPSSPVASAPRQGVQMISSGRFASRAMTSRTAMRPAST